MIGTSDYGRRRSSQSIKQVALLYVLPLCLLFAVAHTVIHYNQRYLVEQQANEVDREFSGRVGELRSLMTSLFAVHSLTSDFVEERFLVYAEQLLEQAPFVSGIGRVDKVTSDSRDEFEQAMSERGLFNFHINQIGITGEVTPSGGGAIHYPISMLEPMTPAVLRLIGADLNSVPGLVVRLEESIEDNQPTMVRLPDAWPLGGKLMYIQPSYLGKHVPESPEERAQQFDVAYFIASDLEDLQTNLESAIERFDVRLSLASESGEYELIGEAESKLSGVWLGWMFPRETLEFRYRIGSTALVLSLSTTVGFSSAALASWVLASVLLLATMLLLNTVLSHRARGKADRMRARAAVFKEREKAEQTLNSIDDAVFTLDHELLVTHMNRAATRLLGVREDSAAGSTLDDLVHLRRPGDARKIYRVADAVARLPVSGRLAVDVEPVTVGQSGHSRTLRLSLTRTSGSERQAGEYVAVFRDISSEAEFTRELEYQANHDSLTGCTNRHYFERRLDALLQDLPLTGRQHAICYIDLDQFKIVNDTCGHRAGDRLLCELTDNLNKLIRGGDVLSRLGGDEFGLIIVDADGAAARAAASRIMAFFRSFVFHHEDKAFAVRASMGLVLVNDPEQNMADVLSAADIACYSAKDSGRNGLVEYSADDIAMTERSAEMSWLPRLQGALQNDEFRLYVQPLARIGDGTLSRHINHYEFLLRLADPSGVEITPWQFIKAAERYDLMAGIDRWVIEHAIASIAGAADRLDPTSTWSINLSGQSAADPTLIDFILEQFRHHQLDPSRVWFELTETAAISQFNVARELIRGIRDIGSKVALDDFGSGLSSFGYLKNLPVDVIKIDGQFVRDLAESRVDQEMVRAINQIGVAMGIETVAEFVENEATVAKLIDIGVDYVQGYHIGKPVPFADALRDIALDRAA